MLVVQEERSQHQAVQIVLCEAGLLGAQEWDLWSISSPMFQNHKHVLERKEVAEWASEAHTGMEMSRFAISRKFSTPRF